MERRRLTPLLALAASAVAAACGAGDAREPVVVQDSAGVRIIESRAPAWQPGRLRVAEEPVLSIGMVDGPPEYQLFRVTGAVRLSDGRIVIANSGTRELRFYDANGAHLHTAGREGGGPGEFASLSWLGRTGADTLLAWDGQARRLSTFDPEGNFVTSVNAGMDLPGFAVVMRGIFSDGSFVLEPGEDPLAFISRGTGAIRDTVTLFRFGPDGAGLGAIGRFPGDERFVYQREGGFSLGDVFFGRRTFAAVRGDRLYVADNDRFEVATYAADGSLRERIRRTHKPVRVEPRHVEEARQQALAAWSEALRRQREPMIAETPARETLPAFQGFVIDRTGRLWLEEYRLPGELEGRWNVFDTDGRWLGTVQVPAGLRILEIGEDYLLAAMRDDLDVEYVRMFRIERAGE
ncbi:MAG TPA: hypothetical protein VKZ58_02765 [Longimicrobiales bacterium]|nr:hypothetical protein [Longimicrobiales bacterium]